MHLRSTKVIATVISLVAACAGDDPAPKKSDSNSASTKTDTSAADKAAAGSKGGAAGAPSIKTEPAPAPSPSIKRTPPAEGTAVAEDCRGFSFEGLVYSPGGTALPNKCEPFHPTTNNPYAVRCIDAWPWFKTQFPGDQFCILPPPPGKGVQYGVHPQGKKWFEQVSKGDMSGYEGLSDEWTMKDGDEEQFNYETGIDSPEPANYYRNYARMRPGSHHMIVSGNAGTAKQEVWGPAAMTGLGAGTSLPGAQRPDENAPKSLEKPSDDDGLFSKLPKNPGVTFNMHHFNASGTTILKEAWTNLWWEDDARIEVQALFGLPITQTLTLAVQPGETQDLHYSWNIAQPVRLVTAFGHRHAWTTNFTSWVEEQDGTREIIYQSFGWLDEPTYRYDSSTQNPKPAPESLSDGAASGLRMLMPGQKLHFNCHIEYTNERAASEGAPTPSTIGTLRFANEAFTAEMCILFGSTAAVKLSSPSVDASPLPDFATVD